MHLASDRRAKLINGGFVLGEEVRKAGIGVLAMVIMLEGFKLWVSAVTSAVISHC